MDMYKKYKNLLLKRKLFKKISPSLIVLIVLCGILVFLVKNIGNIQDLRSSAYVNTTTEIKTAVYSLVDVLNETDKNSRYGTTSMTNWMGTGNNINSSFLGLRFKGPVLETGVKIVDAKLVLTSSKSVSKGLFVKIFAEKKSNPINYNKDVVLTYPSARALTTSYDGYTYNSILIEKDKSYTLYATNAVKEIVSNGLVNQGWINLISKGTSRKPNDMFYFYNHLVSGKEPKLIVTYYETATPIPTPTLAQSTYKNFPIQLNSLNKEAKVMVNLSSKPLNTTSVRLNLTGVYDAENVDEGELYINGNGPIILFKDKTGPDSATVNIEYITDKNWWKEGDNDLLFKHVYTSGYNVGGASATAVYTGTPTIAPTSTPIPQQDYKSFPIQLNSISKEAKVLVNLLSKPSNTQSVKLTLINVYDGENTNEGELYINGNGPIALFGNKTGPDAGTVNIEFITNKDWWRQGGNDLLFRHLATSGFNVGGATAMAVTGSTVTPVIPTATRTPTVNPNPPVNGYTYYVSPSGSDSNSGTSSSPFRTIGKAASMVNPGNSVYISGGKYQEVVSFTRSGTQSAPITYYGDEQVVIDGLNRTPDWSDPRRGTQFGIRGNYMIIKNITVTNSPSAGIEVSGSNNILEQVKVFDSYYGFLVFNGSGNKLINCESAYNFDFAGNPAMSNSPGESANGFNVEGYNNVFEGCISHHNSDDGFDGWNVSGATLKNCIAYANGVDVGNRNRDKSRYTGNFSGDGNGFKLGLGNGGNANSTVINCLAYDNTMSGFDPNGGRNNKFINCTSYNNGLGFSNWGGATGTIFINNLAYGNKNNTDMSGSPTQTTNSWNNPPGLTVRDSDFVSLDRNNSNFLKLTSTSQWIDRGTIYGGYSYSGSAPDIGFYELVK